MTIYDVILLLGGLALFLFGMRLMSEKLERVAGKGLKKTLSLMTKNRVTGLIAGTLATGVLQSSSAVTVLVVGFVNAGLMSLKSAAGVIMGANIGTTVTGLLLSVQVNLGAAFAAAGMIISVLSRRDRVKQAGQTLLSLGVLFTGMQLMTAAMEPLKNWNGMKYLMLGIDQPLLAVLLGAGVTAILQSSSATVGILQALALQGLMPVQTAFYVVLGTNIGTCVTAVIAAAGANVNARRAAALHLLFNVIGTAVFFAAAQYLPLMEYVSLVSSNIKLQIALVHIVFNVATTLLLLPFAGLLVKLGCLLVRGKAEDGALKFYDERMLSTPAFALAQLEKETQRLCEMSRKHLQLAVDSWQGDALPDSEDYAERCAETARAVTEGLIQVKGKTGSERDGLRIRALLHAVSQAQRLARHAQNLCDLRTQHADLTFSEEAADDLLLMAHKALNLADMAQQALFDGKMSGEKQQSMQLMARDAEDCAKEMHERHLSRLVSGECSTEDGVVYLEALHDITRAAAHAGALAQE